jgi:hypothetical protein
MHQEILGIEREARAVAGLRTAELFNRAGDLCLREGQPHRALTNFGRAIDLYLQAGLLDAAPALCRKVIRFAPWVIRTRATLTSISLANGLFDDAERDLADYVHAAGSTRQDLLTAKRLRLMAAATDSDEIRMEIGEYLLGLGDPAAADTVFGNVFAEHNGLQPPLSDDAEERWGRLLPVALLGPGELVKLEARYELR